MGADPKSHSFDGLAARQAVVAREQLVVTAQRKRGVMMSDRAAGVAQVVTPQGFVRAGTKYGICFWGPWQRELAARESRPTRVSGTLTDPFRGNTMLPVGSNTMVPVGTEDSLSSELLEQRAVPRRTPRVSLIVVLPENHVVSPDRLAECVRAHGDQQVDVVIACAGRPVDLTAPQRSVSHAQFLLAPAGTTAEELRELAMRQVPGDIVSLLSGALVPESGGDAELFMTS